MDGRFIQISKISIVFYRLQEKATEELRLAAQTNISWNQDMPEIIKEIVTIGKFRD